MKIAFVMGSDSDLPVVEKGVEIVKQFGVETEVRIISAHRTPHQAEAFAREAEDNGIGVIGAAEGIAAHLGGVLATFTTLPVVALPIKSSALDGLDSLLSMVQMPPGIPVATVAIDGGVNAGLVALQILGVSDPVIKEKLKAYKKEMEDKVVAKDEEVRARFA